MKVTILEYPTNEDWIAVKQRALVTVGLKAKTPPTNEWKYKILKARHSPIRRLRFSVLLPWYSPFCYFLNSTIVTPASPSPTSPRRNDFTYGTPFK